MTQREKYNLEFVWRSKFNDSYPIPIKGILASYLVDIIWYYNLVDDIDGLLQEVESDIKHNILSNESYSIDQAVYIASYNGFLVVGREYSPTHPNNHKIPLTDFRDLLLEWKDFLIQEGIS